MHKLPLFAALIHEPKVATGQSHSLNYLKNRMARKGSPHEHWWAHTILRCAVRQLQLVGAGTVIIDMSLTVFSRVTKT